MNNVQVDTPVWSSGMRSFGPEDRYWGVSNLQSIIKSKRDWTSLARE